MDRAKTKVYSSKVIVTVADSVFCNRFCLVWAITSASKEEKKYIDTRDENCQCLIELQIEILGTAQESVTGSHSLCIHFFSVNIQ